MKKGTMLAPFSIIFFELLLIWDLIWGAFGPNLPQIVSKISQIVKNINKINLHENEAPALFPVGFQCAGSPPSVVERGSINNNNQIL